LAISILRGGVYDVDWSPSRGSEQSGIRPFLVVQNNIANGVAAYPVTIVLALSTKLKGYPAMVRIEPTQANGLDAPSEVNTGQIITVDKSRLGRCRGRLSADDMSRVEEKLTYILSL
jgi:mRNA interferase MazF